MILRYVEFFILTMYIYGLFHELLESLNYYMM